MQLAIHRESVGTTTYREYDHALTVIANSCEMHETDYLNELEKCPANIIDRLIKMNDVK